jgi:hypothetical protein
VEVDLRPGMAGDPAEQGQDKQNAKKVFHSLFLRRWARWREMVRYRQFGRDYTGHVLNKYSLRLVVLTLHVVGQRKSRKPQDSLQALVINTQNIAQKTEVLVRLQDTEGTVQDFSARNRRLSNRVECGYPGLDLREERDKTI